MGVLCRTAGLVVVLGHLTVAGFGAPVKVFLLGGQSNMSGRACSSELPTSPVNLQQPQPDALLFNGYNGWLPIDHLVPLQPGSGEDFGPEVTFGRAMADARPEETFALIKWARGGTDLASDWNPAGGLSYQRFRTTVTRGLRALADAGYTPEVVGMLWMQGETEGHDAAAAAVYGSYLAAFIADIRGRYGAKLPFLIAETFQGEYGDVVSAAQAAVAAADPLTCFIPTRTFSFKCDGVHLDAVGQQELGRAFAAAYLGCLLLPDAWVTVADPGNEGELSGQGAGGQGEDRICGAVDYVYRAGRGEITNGQYIEFLNSIAADDAHGTQTWQEPTAA